MVYDAVLADRLRDALTGVEHREQKMFGGLGFLIGGHMAVAASSEGGLLLRCDPDDTVVLEAAPGVARFEMRGKAMSGWLRVDAAAVESDAELGRWVAVGVDYATGLAPK